MNIESMRVVRATMPRTDPQWRTASYAASAVDGLLIEIRADGAVGIGGTIARPKGVPAEELAQQLTDLVQPMLVGRDAFARTLTIQALRGAGVHHSLVSAVDIALHDLLGNATNLPCYALWGGPVRSSLAVVRMVGIKPVADLIPAVADMMEDGFTHFKVKLGTGVAEDEERIRALRASFGDGIWLGIDGNGAYSVDDAIALSRALAPYGVSLVEQPIDYTDLEGLARLTAASPIPIMADQYVTSAQAAMDVCQRHAAHAVSIKVGQTGTIDECRSIAQMCLAAGVHVHIGGTAHPSVIDAAHAHLAMAVPGIDEQCEVGECLAVTDDPTSGLIIRDGRCEPGPGPGLGITLSA